MIKEILKLYLIGLVLGSAFIIPGLSGGVLAVTFGIYDKIIFYLTTIKTNFKKSVIFLLPLFLGVVSSIILFIKLILYFIDNYYVCLVLFFTGVIIAGIPMIYKKAINNNKLDILYMIFGTLITVIPIIININFNIENYNFIIFILLFLLGILLSLTIVLPGISGSLILINLGLYEPILKSINELIIFENTTYNIILLLPIFVGILLGIYLFTKLIYYLLREHNSKIYSFIFGIIISSLVLILYNIFEYSFSTINIIIGFMLMLISYFLCTKIFKNQL